MWWILIIDVLLCNTQILPSVWKDNGCIPDNEYFICISLDSLRNLNWIRNDVSYVNIEITSTSSDLSPIYRTDSYRIDNTNTRNINDLSMCFYPNVKTIINPSIQFSIYNNNNNDTLIASYTVDNIDSLNMTTNQLPIQFTEYWENITNIFNISAMTHIPQIRFSLWLSSLQCIEITNSIMYFPNDYNLNIQMYRSNKNNEITQNTMFQTNKYMTYDSLQSFNSILCLSGTPTQNTQELVGANFTLNDATTSRSYSLYTINSKYTNFYVTPSEYWKQTSYDTNILHFAIGNIYMNYWQSCSLTNITTNNNPLTYEHIITNTMKYTILLLSSLVFIILICICSGCYTCKSYKGSDPIHYSNILWCLLSIWDFSSQLMFSSFLILQMTYLTDDNNTELVLILLIAIASSLLISYLCNLLYLIHYLQIWNDPSAPGVTRHWLELWSWLLIFITMTMGGVQTSLELCNCLIIPIDVFSMHLSHSELVRIRKDRFVILMIQDIPILIIIIIYICLFHFNDIGFMPDIKYIVIINVLFSTIISIIITSIFRILRRNYSHDNPIAQYQFSFTLKSNIWQSYWIHSHKKIQKCFKYAFDLRKLSLTIIDQCSESLNSMKIEGRLLRDDKHKSERVEKMAIGNITKNEMKQIGLDLLKQFKNEFNLYNKNNNNNENDIRIDHLTIKPIYGGEIVYNHRTCIQILCFGFFDCIQTIGHKCCPSFIKLPPNRRQSVIPIKSPKSYNSNEISIDNILPSPKSFDFNNNTSSNKSLHSSINNSIAIKPMTLSVDKSKDDSRSNTSNSNLPMITISSQLEQDINDENNNESNTNNNIDESKDTKELSQSQSTRNIINKETLFADVYNENNNGNISPALAEVTENTETMLNNPPNIINSKEWYDKYKQIKQEMNKKSTDQYGYESKRKITFLSTEEKIKKQAGDAPITFSQSTNNLLSSQNQQDTDLYDDPENDYMEEDIDI